MAHCGYRDRCISPARCDEAQTCQNPYPDDDEMLHRRAVKEHRERAAALEAEKIRNIALSGSTPWAVLVERELLAAVYDMLGGWLSPEARVANAKYLAELRALLQKGG